MVRSHSRLSADQNSPLLQKLLPEPASLASYRAREYVSGDIVCSQERKQCQEQSQQVLKGKSWKILAHYKGGVGGPSVFQRHVRHRTSPCTPFEGGIISFIGGATRHDRFLRDSRANNILRMPSQEGSHIHDGSFQQAASGLPGSPGYVRRDNTVPGRQEGIVLSRRLNR